MSVSSATLVISPTEAFSGRKNERDLAAFDTQVHVTTDVDPQAAAELLCSLSTEDSTHSWRKLLPDTGVSARDVEHLLEHEQRHRPTTFYWFYSTQAGGAAELFGVATLADRISASFPIEGFPVIARSYIRPAYRGRGLYSHLARHRVKECRARFGGELRGIHFGTNEPSVLNANRRQMPTMPICLGEELITLPEGQRHVSCYMSLVPRYLEQLRGELEELAANHALYSAAQRFLVYGFEREGAAISGASLSAAVRALGTTVDLPAWRELFAFCDAVPLVA
jgi:GNAT superfamily N-acetyltransferase